MWYDKQENINYEYEMTFPLRKILGDTRPEEALLCFPLLTPMVISNTHTNRASEPPLWACFF